MNGLVAYRGEIQRRQRSNAICTSKYSLLTFLPKNLFEQFRRWANLYFLFLVALNWVPQLNVFGKEISMLPLLIVLAVTMVKDGMEDYERHKTDILVNGSKCRRLLPSGVEQQCSWQDIRVQHRVGIIKVEGKSMIVNRSRGYKWIRQVEWGEGYIIFESESTRGE